MAPPGTECSWLLLPFLPSESSRTECSEKRLPGKYQNSWSRVLLPVKDQERELQLPIAVGGQQHTLTAVTELSALPWAGPAGRCVPGLSFSKVCARAVLSKVCHCPCSQCHTRGSAATQRGQEQSWPCSQLCAASQGPAKAKPDTGCCRRQELPAVRSCSWQNLEFVQSLPGGLWIINSMKIRITFPELLSLFFGECL